MKSNARLLLYSASAGLFFILDRIAKYIAYTHQEQTIFLLKPFIAWRYFENTGIAFGIPIPLWMVIITTPLLLLGFWLVWTHKQTKTILFFTAISFFFFGALSNFVDRLLFSFTIDYIQIFTSIINIADIMIFVSALLIVREYYKTNH